MAGRAVLAVLLTIGFYVLAIGLIIVLLAIPYLEWTELHRLNIRIALFCLAGAGLILLSILPRFEHFRAPGDRVTATSHPKLFAELSAIAMAVGEPLPPEVYLVQEINAFVRERGGFMGFGGRRVMGIGVPLMHILRVSEFRFVLIHEFGHYRHGHTQLAPWIYKTRESLLLTLANLSGYSGMLMWPFMQYAQMFLTLTEGISRQQEYEADAMGARLVGGQACIAGLRALYGASKAYDYFRRENTGVLVDHLIAGPDPDESFLRYMQLPRIGALIRQSLDYELAHPKPHPFDSHPVLAARIAFLKKFPPGNDSSREPLAFSLLDPLPFDSTSSSPVRNQPVPAAGAMPWEDAGAGSGQFRWEEDVRRNFHILRGWTVGSLPDLVPSVAVVGGHLGPRFVPDDAAAQSGRELLAAALALALQRVGWVADVAEGRSVLRKGEAVVDPRAEVEQLATGGVDASAWRAKTTALGIGALRLDALRPAA
ncbi:MAG TPA: M48 family metallopeptidase [Candidatus Angelobacter sp.]|nr:M48 family metallopeptidase [Candidatus Angelobacter sp.]